MNWDYSRGYEDCRKGENPKEDASDDYLRGYGDRYQLEANEDAKSYAYSNTQQAI